MPSSTSFLSSLHAFTTSSASFRILHSLPPSPTAQVLPPRTLYILDSSFNPPTLAHLRICFSALQNDTRAKPGPRRLLLLLATQNADKPAKPAAFEHRLSMMGMLAQELQRRVAAEHRQSDALYNTNDDDNGEELVPVDIGVCKPPLFVDKVRAIEESRIYGEEAAEQVHLIGFDTLQKLFDPKYYPPKHTLRPLNALFDQHRVRVMERTGDSWGIGGEQRDYLRGLGDGSKEAEGGKREWIDRIDLVDGRRADEDVISSTKVREAVRRDDQEKLHSLVPKPVAEYIFQERLYKEAT